MLPDLIRTSPPPPHSYACAKRISLPFSDAARTIDLVGGLPVKLVLESKINYMKNYHLLADICANMLVKSSIKDLNVLATDHVCSASFGATPTRQVNLTVG